MKNTFLVLSVALCCSLSYAQPNIAWQSTYGGAADERINAAIQTPDGGYLLVGHTTSSGGQVVGHQGNEDVWVVKTDANGTLLWQRAMGSGASEFGYAAASTADGGYIIAGTASSNGGDIASVIGDGDVWLVKLNAGGNIVWESTYGGTSYDAPWSVVEVDDGYVVAGYTESDDGQVSGYHGSGDMWVFKVNGTGVLTWQRCIGGTNSDGAFGMRRTADNGVIIAGVTASDNGDVAQNFGNMDAWLVKLNASGAIQWNQVYGHTGDEAAMDVVQRTDGGYAFLAMTNSQGGQVGQSFGNFDYWLVRTDANGVLEGQTSYGGSGDDQAYALQQTGDGGFILAGTSVSDNGTVTNPLGGFDFWVVKTTATGVLEWQRNLGGSDDDEAFAVVRTTDGGYLVAGLTNSEDQDVTLGRGGEDFWAVKLQGGGVGLQETDPSAETLEMFPIPASGPVTVMIHVKFPGPTLLRVLDGTGRLMVVRDLGSLPAGDHRLQLDVAGWAAGSYHLELERGTQRIQRMLMVVR